MTSRGEVPARVLKRARILLLLNEGWARWWQDRIQAFLDFLQDLDAVFAAL